VTGDRRRPRPGLFRRGDGAARVEVSGGGEWGRGAQGPAAAHRGWRRGRRRGLRDGDGSRFKRRSAEKKTRGAKHSRLIGKALLELGSMVWITDRTAEKKNNDVDGMAGRLAASDSYIEIC
jgi:intein/homing endonuclease